MEGSWTFLVFACDIVLLKIPLCGSLDNNTTIWFEIEHLFRANIQIL